MAPTSIFLTLLRAANAESLAVISILTKIMKFIDTKISRQLLALPVWPTDVYNRKIIVSIKYHIYSNA